MPIQTTVLVAIRSRNYDLRKLIKLFNAEMLVFLLVFKIIWRGN
jgi:hypothetical protein